ncbi:CFDP2 [Symbiodinium sp. CCMP2456]|nr:CFDP2 [Symbiodinium sp. CCMP2456]
MCISLRLAGDEGCFHLVSVYAPTMQRPETEKDEFWDELQTVWQALPAREPAWILGDFNSRIGINTAAAPSPAAEGVHGPYGLGQLNANGERFLHFCSEAHLKVLNTFFQHSADELTSWVHRRWGTQGMIDYAVGHAADWCFVLDTHSLPHAEVNSDHRLMVLKLRAEVERLRQGAAPGFPSLSHDLYQAGVSILGTAQRRTSDWREGHDATLRAAAARRQRALESLRLSPGSQACLQELRDARHASRRVVRDLKARWWSSRLRRLEAAARRNDAATAYSDAKEMGRLLRSQSVSVEPLAASPDADLTAKAAHFQAVLNVQRPVSPHIWDEIPDLSSDAADISWDPPTEHELRCTIMQLSNGKAPDASGVHAELLKVFVQTMDPAGDAVIAEFHDLVQRLWRGEQLDLTTWHSSLLFSIWKGRGLVTDLDGHRGIVLLDVLNKVVCKMLASRLSELAEKHCAESETGYRRGVELLSSYSSPREQLFVRSIEGPVLFLLYFAVVMKVWRQRCGDALGVRLGSIVFAIRSLQMIRRTKILKIAGQHISKTAQFKYLGAVLGRAFPSASEVGAHCHHYTGRAKMVMQTLALDNWSESRLLAATLHVLTERECTLTVVLLCKWCPHCNKVYRHKGYFTMHCRECRAFHAPAPAAAGQSAHGQDALQAQQPNGGRADRARKPLVALSTAELTLAFVSQQDQLDQLQQQCAAVFRFASDNVFALRLLAAVDQWKADHRPGRPHPLGACATAVALAMLFGISDAGIPPACNEEAAKALQTLAAELLAGEAATVAREFSHCSARLTAKKEHIILDCRPTLYGRIFPFYNVLCQLLEVV